MKVIISKRHTFGVYDRDVRLSIDYSKLFHFINYIHVPYMKNNIFVGKPKSFLKL